MSTDVHFITADDWAALYVNLEIVYQGHDIPLWVIAEQLSHIGTLSITNTQDDDFCEYLEEHGEFPRYLGTLWSWTDEQH